MRTSLRTIGGRIASDGSVAGGSGFASNKNSTGNYTIKFAEGIRIVGFSAMGNGSQVIVYTAASPTGNSVTLQSINTAFVAADAPIIFTAAIA